MFCPSQKYNQTAPYSYSPSNTAPTPYAVTEQTQNYTALDPAFYSATYPDPAPDLTPCEIPQPVPYTYSATALSPKPYVSADPMPAG